MAKTTTSNTSIFSSANARMVASAPAVWTGDVLAFGAECARKAAEFIGGGQEKRVAGYNYLAVRTTGSFSNTKLKAMAEKLKEQKGGKEEEVEIKVPEGHYLDEKTGLWKTSKGYLWSNFKGVNWLIKWYKGEEGYKAENGEEHSALGWAYHHFFVFAKNSGIHDTSDKVLSNIYKGARRIAVYSGVSADKLPSYEELVKVAQEEATATPAQEVKETKQEAAPTPAAKEETVIPMCGELKVEGAPAAKKEARQETADSGLAAALKVLGKRTVSGKNALVVAKALVKEVLKGTDCALTADQVTLIQDACLAVGSNKEAEIINLFAAC